MVHQKGRIVYYSPNLLAIRGLFLSEKEMHEFSNEMETTPMNATKLLIKEHAIILKVLDSLSSARNHIENGRLPEKLFFEQAVRFSRDFSDTFHHFKEEFLMFGMLAQKKEGDIDLEIGALRYQHEKCRGFIKGIDASLKGYGEKDELSITMLLENLAPYISLLRRHIYQENHLFFPLVEQSLTEMENQYLLEQFAKEEERFGGKTVFVTGKNQADELARMVQRIAGGM
ncbi:MAG: hemerythrin domain-containing protein [Desulfosalsimonadaceae bacterium]